MGEQKGGCLLLALLTKSLNSSLPGTPSTWPYIIPRQQTSLLCSAMLQNYDKRLRLTFKAVSTRLSSSLLILPRRRIKRDFSIVMTCSHFTSVKSVRPFSSEG